MSLEVFIAVNMLDVFLLVGTIVLGKPAIEGRRFLLNRTEDCDLNLHHSESLRSHKIGLLLKKSVPFLETEVCYFIRILPYSPCHFASEH